MKREILAKFKHKKRKYTEVRSRNGRNTEPKPAVRKAKAQMELNLVRYAKDNKKNISDKRESRQNVGVLLNESETLVTQDMEKAEVLNAFLTSVFISKIDLQESQTPEIRGKC